MPMLKSGKLNSLDFFSNNSKYLVGSEFNGGKHIKPIIFKDNFFVIRFSLSKQLLTSGSPLDDGFSNYQVAHCSTAETNLGSNANRYSGIFQRIEYKSLHHLKWGTGSAKDLTISFYPSIYSKYFRGKVIPLMYSWIYNYLITL